VEQVVPQAPQLLLSVWRFVQLPGAAPHLSGLVVGQLHTPLTQDAPAAHAVPHAPQFAASADRSTHAVPHVALPVAHAQTPELHT